MFLSKTRKSEHSRKSDDQCELIERCSPANCLELVARGERPDWPVGGNQADETYALTWKTYSYNSSVAE